MYIFNLKNRNDNCVGIFFKKKATHYIVYLLFCTVKTIDYSLIFFMY